MAPERPADLPRGGGWWSASGGLPQFHEQEQGGDGGGKDEGEEEEVDEGVHARQSNTGGRTSAGGGRIILRLSLRSESGHPPTLAVVKSSIRCGGIFWRNSLAHGPFLPSFFRIISNLAGPFPCSARG